MSDISLPNSVVTSQSCTVNETLHIYNARDCLWPWEV